MGSNPIGGTKCLTAGLVKSAAGHAILGYGVIGNTADSGSAVLGSSPGIPAIKSLGDSLLGGFVFVSPVYIDSMSTLG